MPRLLTSLVVLPMVLLASIAHSQSSGSAPLTVSSPSGADRSSSFHREEPTLRQQTSLSYSVDFRGKRLMDDSPLGLKLEGQPPLGPGMHSVGAKHGAIDETYTIPVGKTSSVRDHYNSAACGLRRCIRTQAGN